MKAEQLLKPRFEVIANYPDSNLSIGDVLTKNLSVYGTGNPQEFVRNPMDYPHLFRKLNWWEKRTKEEMPKRLTCKAIPNDNEVIEIEEWDVIQFNGHIKSNNGDRYCASLTIFSPECGYFPVD